MPHTVLLVDDDGNLLAGLRRALHREPYRLLVADSGAAAVSLLQRQPADVVISDEAMPGMRGTDLLAHVRATYPDTIRMILTGQRQLEVAVRAINEGEVYRFFTKPCDPVELAVAIRQALQHRELLLQSRRLLTMVRRQSAVIEELNRQFPGLTHVARDHSGAVVIDEAPTDLEALLREVETELEVTDRQLASTGHGSR